MITVSVMLNQAELNELIFALGMNRNNQLVNKVVSETLEERLRDSLDDLNSAIDELESEYSLSKD
jgi:hypothetical protein